MTRGLQSCITCAMLFSLLDEHGRCRVCSERWSILARQPLSLVFRKPVQLCDPAEPVKRRPGRPVRLERRCNVCMVTKLREAFPEQAKITTELRGRCSECIEAYREDRRNARKLEGANRPAAARGGGWIVPADAEGRACRGCGKFLPWSSFHKSSAGFNGHHPRCKRCNYKKVHPNKVIDHNGRTCTRCHEYKPWDKYQRKTASPTGHIAICSECFRRLHACR